MHVIVCKLAFVMVISLESLFTTRKLMKSFYLLIPVYKIIIVYKVNIKKIKNARKTNCVVYSFRCNRIVICLNNIFDITDVVRYDHVHWLTFSTITIAITIINLFIKYCLIYEIPLQWPTFRNHRRPRNHPPSVSMRSI